MSQENKNAKSQTEVLLQQTKRVMTKIEEQRDHFDHLRYCAKKNHYKQQEELNKIMKKSLHCNGETYNILIEHANMLKAAMECTNKDKDSLAEFQTRLDQIETVIKDMLALRSRYLNDALHDQFSKEPEQIIDSIISELCHGREDSKKMMSECDELDTNLGQCKLEIISLSLHVDRIINCQINNRTIRHNEETIAALRNHSTQIDDSLLNSSSIKFDSIHKTLKAARELTNTGRTLKNTIYQSVSKGKETLTNLTEKCNLELQNRISSVNQNVISVNHAMNNLKTQIDREYKSLAHLDSRLREESSAAETLKVQLEQFENYAQSEYINERFICKDIIALKTSLEYRMKSIRDLTEAIQNAQATIDKLHDFKISLAKQMSSIEDYGIMDKLLSEKLSLLL
ncbi:hypothetical protein GJ496_006914 [Pomphorhynchus laevis]|nr:hypothetical protein GJ496_006914 [Pomphorhynchus laevis]